MSKLFNRLLTSMLTFTPPKLSPDQLLISKTFLNAINVELDLENQLNSFNEIGLEMKRLQKLALKAPDEEKELHLYAILDTQLKALNLTEIFYTKMISARDAQEQSSKNEQINLAKDLIPSIKTLVSLAFKARRLKHAGHLAAARATRELIDVIGDEIEDKTISLKRHMDVCMMAINKARPELENHRDNNYILANIGLAFLTLGVGYLLAILVNKVISGHFLFFSKTDTAQKVDFLEKQLTQLVSRSA